MQGWFKTSLPWLVLSLIIIGLGAFYYFHWYEYLSYSSLKQHHEQLHQFANQHYLLTVTLYMLVYIIAVALSIPGAIFITLAGGFLFGPLATVYVVVSATIGATIIFLTVRTTLGQWLEKKVKKWTHKMKNQLQENAFYYLLFLRLIPLFPFWVINIVPALVNVQIKIFMMATFIGIIPGSLIYVMVGNGLNKLFQTNQKPNLQIIFTPSLFLPLIGLAILALLPVFYKKIKGKKR